MPSEKRVLAGKLNRQLRGELTPEGRETLRKAALARRPWEHSTGPRTTEGKAKSASNGRVRQKGPKSVREIRADAEEINALIERMRIARGSV